MDKLEQYASGLRLAVRRAKQAIQHGTELAKGMRGGVEGPKP
jgi:hypothetical protein